MEGIAMTRMNRRLFLIGLGGSLIAVPRLARGEAKNNPYRFALLPGATSTIAVSFNSANENAMSFWDERSGGGENRFRQWPGCGNYDKTHPKTFEFTNGETGSIPFAFN